MKLSKHQVENIVVIAISGELDGSTAKETLNYFQDHYEGSEDNFIADLSQLSYTSSAGLRVFLSVLKELRSKGGDLRLVGIQDNVHKVFSATGFTRMFKIFDTLDGGVESFTS